jgi:hypothetical protein
MGTVQVNTNSGVLNFTIKGDTPTPVEQMRIQKILREQSLKNTKTSERKKAEQMFDYRTGIQNNELRRKLSRAENADEEALALKTMGLSETDFTRDYRGRLALTPQGAKRFGVESDRNVIIDERGFTRSDFADLSSLGREIAGGVAGALVGQAAIPIPILGAAIGAGLGTGGAKLIEEGQEVVEGTQGQTAKEVFKDAAVEAAIGAAGEGAGQVLFKTVGKLFGKPGGDLTQEQLELAGKSMEYGVTPTLSQIGANKLVARQQAMGEKVLGTSKRLRDNHQAITSKLEDFRSSYGASNPDEVAEVMINAAKTGNKTVENQIKNYRKEVIKNFKEANEALGAATRADAAIDDDLFKILRNSYKAFDDDMQAQFSAINKLVDDATGKVAAFDVSAIRADALEELKGLEGVTTGNLMKKKEMLQGITNLPDQASFAQIYQARKSLNDNWLSNFGSSNVKNVKDKFLGRLDEKLDIKEVKRALNRVNLRDLSPEQKAMYRAASRQIVPARDAFRKGIEQYENLHGKLGLRSLVADVKGGKTPNIVGGANALIKNNNPKPLQAVKTAIGEDRYNPIKSRLAGEWMRTAFKESMKDNNPTTFSVKKFKEKLDGLGTTADELFGKNLPEINKLADQMSVLNLSKVTDSMIDEVVARGADESGVNLLRNLKFAMDEKAALDKSRAIKALQDGSITPQAAAEVIANRATKDVDVAKLVKYFDAPEDLDTIRAFYVDNIIGDFGDAFLTDPKQFKMFGQRLQDEYKTGKLTTVFGDDVAKDMNDFGRVMVFNSKAAEGGDLVAANIAAKPLENLGTLARLSIIGRVLSTGPQYKSIMKQYNQMTKGASQKTKAQVLGNLLANAFSSASSQAPLQIIQEGIQEGSQQLSSTLESARNQNKKSTLPPTPVPQVLPPIETNSVNQTSNIRQRAKENPAVAATLLGGLGSAGLL